MKKDSLLKILFFLLIFIININFCYAEDYIGTITATGVYLRKGAGTNYSVIKTLSQGNKYKLVSNNIVPNQAGCNDGWYVIYYEGLNTGYVCSTYVSVSASSVEEVIHIDEDAYYRPWTTPKLAIMGGAKYITAAYINKGQFTSYLKKFNVNPAAKYSVYNNQYQTNIAAPSSESNKSSQAYEANGLLKQGSESFPFVFTIPVYNKMDSSYPSPDGARANLTTSDYKDPNFENSISVFPESYRPYLRELHVEHPNWVFKVLNTNLDFETAAIMEQKVGAIQKIAYRYKDENGNYVVTEDSWYLPSLQATKYYMDPRNWLNESFVFQFEDLTYNEVFTEKIVQSVLNKKTIISGFDAIDNRTYASIFVEAGRLANVNSVYLASLSTQEVGESNITGASFEYNGTTYSGLFNFYNIGALSSAANPTKAGLVFAAGGACTICANYSNSNNSSNDSSNDSSSNNANQSTSTPSVTYGNVSNIGASIKANFVVGFNINTSIDSLKSKDGNINYNSSDIIKTGTLVSTGNASYYAVIYGDVSGDGKINSADLLKVRQYLLGKASLSGPYIEDAKVSGDNINSASLLKLRQYLLGKTNINQS